MGENRRQGYQVGVDIGGTFTDCAVLADDGRVVTGKSPTTPHDLSEGFLNAITAAAAELGVPTSDLMGHTHRISHGTTTGLNALVTHTGAKVVLVTTAGHAEAIRIMNGKGRILGATIAEMLDWSISSQPKPILPPELVIEAHERVDSQGNVVVPLVAAEIERIIAQVEASGASAVAISFLWSFANRGHEVRLRECLNRRFPDLHISCSFEVAPRIGAYPRAVATIMNAMLTPLMRDYVQRIVGRVSAAGFGGDVFFVQNEGGLIPAQSAASFPVGTLKSGPVAGLVGAAMAGMQVDDPNIVVADMGGTTFDIGVIEGSEPVRTDECVVQRQLVQLRSVDVVSVGAGGGSIAWIDGRTGTLRVGPQSAGARPGPICYGLGGTEVTVTDADLVLGILDPDRPLAGGLKLDYGAAYRGLERLGRSIGLDPVRSAAGVVEVVDSLMEDLVRQTTVQRGLDPRDFSLWVYGGAAGAHAGLFSRQLRVKRIVLPLGNTASAWSALGCTLLEQRREFYTSVYVVPPWNLALLKTELATLEDDATRYAGQVGLAPGNYRTRRLANMKYGLQVHEVEVELPAGDVGQAWATALIDRFEHLYEDRFGEGTGFSGASVILTALRVVVEAEGQPPTIQGATASGSAPQPDRSRKVFWREYDDWRETPVYLGASLVPGQILTGPAIVEYSHTTIVARPEQRLWLEPTGNVILDPEVAS
jgi:N-methylhydantoinase A